jgi:hypothetical protein
LHPTCQLIIRRVVLKNTIDKALLAKVLISLACCLAVMPWCLVVLPGFLHRFLHISRVYWLAQVIDILYRFSFLYWLVFVCLGGIGVAFARRSSLRRLATIGAGLLVVGTILFAIWVWFIWAVRHIV